MSWYACGFMRLKSSIFVCSIVCYITCSWLSGACTE